jgi:hypothetical protein
MCSHGTLLPCFPGRALRDGSWHYAKTPLAPDPTPPLNVSAPEISSQNATLRAPPFKNAFKSRLQKALRFSSALAAIRSLVVYSHELESQFVLACLLS